MGAVGAKKVSFISRFFLTLNFIKSIPSLAATLRLQHRCSIDRENRQNGNQESSEEGSQEDDEKEVNSNQGKARRGTLGCVPRSASALMFMRLSRYVDNQGAEAPRAAFLGVER